MPWLLQFNAVGGGRPWADGTEMAGRAAAGGFPFDDNCRVTTYVDGLTAMSAMRDALETVITNAKAASAANVAPGWQRGYVYIAGWRFNCLRDLSVGNPWQTDPWTGYLADNQANLDQTAMGLVVRLLQAGVMVRIMVWAPTGFQQKVVGNAHFLDHYLAAKIVEHESNRLSAGGGDPWGVVALDARTAEKWSGSHHQKMMVIRSPQTPTTPAMDVAFVGGVDLAYTRRSNLDYALPVPSGDWQSGQTIPDPTQWWPRQTVGVAGAAVNYSFRATGHVSALGAGQGADLPANVYGDSSTPVVRQLWHDQHLQLEGRIVATIEHQFRERWIDQATNLSDTSGLFDASLWKTGQVMFSTNRAYPQNQIQPLPQPAAIPPVRGGAPATSRVQMWRTIPLRPSRTVAPFVQGEFTVMAGIDNAVRQSRELILMFDQYFWNVPLARLLNAQLLAWPNLRLIVILPPYADASYGMAHLSRKNALQALTAGLPQNPATNALSQVGVYNMWYGQQQPAANPANRGIYVHAKCHTYDNALIVCGSANLNRRSLLSDTELACAVLDNAPVSTLVEGHQTKLWRRLFPGAPLPGALNRLVAGWGAQYFTQFQQAASNAANSLLITDPWTQNQPLPNNVVRPVDASLPPDVFYSEFEPSSVASLAETQQVFVQTSQGLVQRDAQLDDIVNRLENQSSIYRKPS